MTWGRWTRTARRSALVGALALALAGCSDDPDQQRGETPPLLEAEVLSFSAPTEETVYAATRGICTGCVDLWTWSSGDDAWSRVAKIDEPPKDVRKPNAHDGEGPLGSAGLQMAADGVHGYLNWYQGLWRTSDGGKSWTELAEPEGVRQGQVEATSDGAALHLGYADCPGVRKLNCSRSVLSRLPHGETGWERLAVPAAARDAFEVTVRNDALTLISLQRETSYIVRSRDEGETWTTVEAPRAPAYEVPGPCNVFPDGVQVFVIACAVDDGYDEARGYFNVYEVQTSPDGEEWTTLGELRGSAPVLAGIEDDRFLVLGELRESETRVLEPDGSLSPVELPAEAGEFGATVRFVSSEIGYWHTYDDLLRTSDGGLTWDVVARTPAYSGE